MDSQSHDSNLKLFYDMCRYWSATTSNKKQVWCLGTKYFNFLAPKLFEKSVEFTKNLSFKKNTHTEFGKFTKFTKIGNFKKSSEKRVKFKMFARISEFDN